MCVRKVDMILVTISIYGLGNTGAADTTPRNAGMWGLTGGLKASSTVNAGKLSSLCLQAIKPLERGADG